jgi:hypothetical protein
MRLRAVLAKALRACGVIHRAGAINRVLDPLSVNAGLVERGLQFTDAVLQQRIG